MEIEQTTVRILKMNFLNFLVSLFTQTFIVCGEDDTDHEDETDHEDNV